MSPGRPARGKKGESRKTPVSRTAELARKRERRSFRFRLVAFTGVMLVLVLAAAYQFWFRDSSFVEIKNLEIVGVTSKTEEGKQIDGAVRTAMGEMTTLNVDPSLLESELARFPRIAESEIETGFPDSATVTLTLRENGSIYGEGSDALLVATDGTVLGPAAGQEDALPLIDASDPETSDSNMVAEGETLTGSDLTQALVLGAAPPEIRAFVTGSRLSSNGVLVDMDDGLIMLFGDSSHADEKWRAATALIADPNFDTGSYVDLTVPRRPAVSAEAPAPDPPEEPQVESAGAVTEG